MVAPLTVIPAYAGIHGLGPHLCDTTTRS